MNHQKVYESIIQKAKSENRKRLRKNNINYIYYENHHILPRCLGGNDNKNNLMLLTAKEHYVCHRLLTYIYKGNYKIECAFIYMSFSKKYNKCMSSTDYVYAKELNAKGPSKETLEKLKNNPYMKNRPFPSPETCLKLSVANTGKVRSEEFKHNLSIQRTGDSNPAKTTEAKAHISAKLKGKFRGDANPMSKSSRKRENLNLLEEKGIKLKGDMHEYLRKKIICTNIETNENNVFDGVQELLHTLKINKRKYYSHLKDNKPILGKYNCVVV